MAFASSAASTLDPLSALLNKANGRKNPSVAYQGEVTPLEAFHYLAENGGLLVDVRTTPEWQFVGVPDLTGCRGKFAAISWKVYPDMTENSSFADQLAFTGVSKDSPIFFLCRGGGRSASAAQAMAQKGYSCCFNVATGFEGEPDANGHRGRVSGWQGAELPWKH